MAVIKVACPKCGQKVSGDESFFGTSVDCPVCTSKIYFPSDPNAPEPNYGEPPLPPVDDSAGSTPPSHPSSVGPDSLPPSGLPSAVSDDFLADVPRRVTQPAPELPKEEPLDLPTASDSGHGGESQSGATAPENNADEISLIPSSSEGSGGSSEDDDETITTSPLLGAIALVLAILGIIFCLPSPLIKMESNNVLRIIGIVVAVFSFLLSPLAIICGHIALARAAHSSEKPAPGRTLALVGTILGYVGIISLMIMLVALMLWNKEAPVE